MKKIFTCAAGFMLAIGLLAGCSAAPEEAPSNEPVQPGVEANPEAQAEFEAMLEANSLENIFNTHVLVNTTSETWAVEDGEEVFRYVIRDTYSSAGAGITYYTETEQADGTLVALATYGDDVTPMASYSTASTIDFRALGVYPQSDYHTYILGQWLTQDPTNPEKAIAVEVDEATGSKMIITSTVYEETAWGVETTYFVDAATGFLTGMEQINYDAATGQYDTIVRTNIWYDEAREFSSDPVAEITQADELCALTVVLNPGLDNEETQQFSVALGTSVSVVALNGFEIYADAECTELVDDAIADAAEKTFYVKFLA